MNKLILFHIDTLYQFALGKIDKEELGKRYSCWIKEDLDKINETLKEEK